MAFIDIFNGDADGITALIQLRLNEPRDARLITGVKRDIALVKQANAQPDDELTVLDISLQKNHAAVVEALNIGADIFYVDHHAAGEPIQRDNFHGLINTTADVCTSLLVNGFLKNKYPLWAIVGAFGDNLHASARALAKQSNLAENDLTLLQELGVLMNYNAYGLTPEDLHFSPEALYQHALQYQSPIAFIQQEQHLVNQLRNGYAEDMQRAKSVSAEFENNNVAVFVLPQAAWARRVNGVLGNSLTNQFPARAHAVLVEKPDGDYLVSVRAALENKQGAGKFCSRFPSGGGREAAAGINALAPDQLRTFIAQFQEFYQGQN